MPVKGVIKIGPHSGAWRKCCVRLDGERLGAGRNQVEIAAFGYLRRLKSTPSLKQQTDNHATKPTNKCNCEDYFYSTH